MTKEEQIRNRLFELRDTKYAAFHKNLMPGFDDDYIIGVRIPQLKKLAKELSQTEEIQEFLTDLPHKYYEENNLHAFMIDQEKLFDKAMDLTEAFLPYVNNWATCDSLAPRSFAKQTDKLLPYIKKWLSSEHTYTVRFGIACLMRWYLGENYKNEFGGLVAAVSSEEYYIMMMQAWYFATALAKNYESILPYLTEHRLSKWVHNKTIQKSIESYRITDKHKEYLRSLRIK